VLHLDNNLLSLGVGVEALQRLVREHKSMSLTTLELHGNAAAKGGNADGDVCFGALCVTLPVTLLGRGARSAVVDGRLGARTVALKFAPCPSPCKQDGFESDLAVLKGADHRNIVRYLHHEFSPVCGGVLLALEKCDCNLAQALEQEEPFFKQHQALDVCRQMAEGLRYLHEELATERSAPESRGFIHGRLSPRHVLLRVSVPPAAAITVKLGGFGSARVLLDSSFSVAPHVDANNAKKMAAQTPWVAPEVLAGAPLRRSADVFALGQIFDLVLHRRPFSPAGGSLDILRRQLCAHMTCATAVARLTAAQVLHHPLFADATEKLRRVADVSDSLEALLNTDAGRADSRAMAAARELERVFLAAGRRDIGESNDWRRSWHDALLSSNNMRIPGTRAGNGSVPAGAYNLLRTCRNHLHHFRTAPLQLLAVALADTPACTGLSATERMHALATLRANEAVYLEQAFLPYVDARVPELHACVWAFRRNTDLSEPGTV
jgi:serine/threonine protein kinase